MTFSNDRNRELTHHCGVCTPDAHQKVRTFQPRRLAHMTDVPKRNVYENNLNVWDPKKDKS